MKSSGDWESLLDDQQPPYGYFGEERAPPPAGWNYDIEQLFVIADLIGPQAEPVIEFLQNQVDDYPYNQLYKVVPGPNSSTFTQWVLDSTGWDIELPRVAVGRRMSPAQPEPELPVSEPTRIPPSD